MTHKINNTKIGIFFTEIGYLPIEIDTNRFQKEVKRDSLKLSWKGDDGEYVEFTTRNGLYYLSENSRPLKPLSEEEVKEWAKQEVALREEYRGILLVEYENKRVVFTLENLGKLEGLLKSEKYDLNKATESQTFEALKFLRQALQDNVDEQLNEIGLHLVANPLIISERVRLLRVADLIYYAFLGTLSMTQLSDLEKVGIDVTDPEKGLIVKKIDQDLIFAVRTEIESIFAEGFDSSYSSTSILARYLEEYAGHMLERLEQILLPNSLYSLPRKAPKLVVKKIKLDEFAVRSINIVEKNNELCELKNFKLVFLSRLRESVKKGEYKRLVETLIDLRSKMGSVQDGIEAWAAKNHIFLHNSVTLTREKIVALRQRQRIVNMNNPQTLKRLELRFKKTDPTNLEFEEFKELLYENSFGNEIYEKVKAVASSLTFDQIISLHHIPHLIKIPERKKEFMMNTFYLFSFPVSNLTFKEQEIILLQTTKSRSVYTPPTAEVVSMQRAFFEIFKVPVMRKTQLEEKIEELKNTERNLASNNIEKLVSQINIAKAESMKSFFESEHGDLSVYIDNLKTKISQLISAMLNSVDSQEKKRIGMFLKNRFMLKQVFEFRRKGTYESDISALANELEGSELFEIEYLTQLLQDFVFNEFHLLIKLHSISKKNNKNLTDEEKLIFTEFEGKPSEAIPYMRKKVTESLNHVMKIKSISENIPIMNKLHEYLHLLNEEKLLSPEDLGRKLDIIHQSYTARTESIRKYQRKKMEDRKPGLGKYLLPPKNKPQKNELYRDDFFKEIQKKKEEIKKQEPKEKIEIDNNKFNHNPFVLITDLLEEYEAREGKVVVSETLIQKVRSIENELEGKPLTEFEEEINELSNEFGALFMKLQSLKLESKENRMFFEEQLQWKSEVLMFKTKEINLKRKKREELVLKQEAEKAMVKKLNARITSMSSKIQQLAETKKIFEALEVQKQEYEEYINSKKEIDEEEFVTEFGSISIKFSQTSETHLKKLVDQQKKLEEEIEANRSAMNMKPALFESLKKAKKGKQKFIGLQKEFATFKNKIELNDQITLRSLSNLNKEIKQTLADIELDIDISDLPAPEDEWSEYFERVLLEKRNQVEQKEIELYSEIGRYYEKETSSELKKAEIYSLKAQIEKEKQAISKLEQEKSVEINKRVEKSYKLMELKTFLASLTDPNILDINNKEIQMRELFSLSYFSKDISEYFGKIKPAYLDALAKSLFAKMKEKFSKKIEIYKEKFLRVQEEAEQEKAKLAASLKEMGNNMVFISERKEKAIFKISELAKEIASIDSGIELTETKIEDVKSHVNESEALINSAETKKLDESLNKTLTKTELFYGRITTGIVIVTFVAELMRQVKDSLLLNSDILTQEQKEKLVSYMAKIAEYSKPFSEALSLFNKTKKAFSLMQTVKNDPIGTFTKSYSQMLSDLTSSLHNAASSFSQLTGTPFPTHVSEAAARESLNYKLNSHQLKESFKEMEVRLESMAQEYSDIEANYSEQKREISEASKSAKAQFEEMEKMLNETAEEISKRMEELEFQADSKLNFFTEKMQKIYELIQKYNPIRGESIVGGSVVAALAYVLPSILASTQALSAEQCASLMEYV